MAILLDGRAIGARIREKVKARVAQMTAKPGLAVILVGDDPASRLYVSLKRKACEEAGIRFELFAYSSDEPEAALLAKIDELNRRVDVTGILVQLPLPSQDADRVVSHIHPNKDVDGFNRDNLRALSEGRPCIVSALALGIMKLIDDGRRVSPPFQGGAGGGSAAVVGSALFAEPLRYLLAQQNIFAERVDPDDAELSTKTKIADILIVGVGRPGMITREAVKPGAIVIDVGTTRVGDRVVGDVNATEVDPVAGARSPVPGGAGPMTVAMLLMNVLRANDLQSR